MNDNQDHFNVLRKITSKPKSTQRELAEELGFSLGKLNYCLKALKNKGLVKMKSFEKKLCKISFFIFISLAVFYKFYYIILILIVSFQKIFQTF